MFFCLFTIGIILAEPTGSVGLFQPLFPRDFAAGNDGTFYILDTKEHRVRHYSKEVEMINSFGGRGEGPGEFFYPSSIQFLDGVVYIEDAAFFTLFDAEGSPLKKKRKPFDADWFPTGKSWIAHKRSQSTGKVEVLWFSQDFQTQKVLDTDQDTTFVGDSFNPSGRPIPIALSKKRNRLAKAHKERFSIKVFDAHNGTLLQVLEEEVTLTPFDRDWGKESAEVMIRMLQAYDALDSKPSSFVFPDYFSAIQRLAYTVDDHLIAYSVLRPGRIKPDFAFDLAGKKIPIKGNPDDYIYKVMMQHDGFAYLNFYNEEEVTIKRVSLEALEAVLTGKE